MEHLLIALPATRVLMMSGSDYAEQAAALGAVAFLDKPYRPADVLRAVAEAIGDEPGSPSRHAA